MENPFDYFEQIYCINLDRRIDRWNLVQKEFNKVGIQNKVKRFSAIEHLNGRIGLLKSFINIFNQAKIDKLDHILIFEDDVCFLDQFKPLETLSKGINQIKSNNINWDLFYLGANTVGRKLIPITDNIVTTKQIYAAHAVCYKNTVFDEIIERYNNVKEPLKHCDYNDVILSDIIQIKYKTIMLFPIIALQFNSYSDLEKRDSMYGTSVRLDLQFLASVKNSGLKL